MPTNKNDENQQLLSLNGDDAFTRLCMVFGGTRIYVSNSARCRHRLNVIVGESMAEKIIEKGREHKVLVVRAPPFARALYFNVELGEDVPNKLYTAAAQVLAYVHQLKHYEQQGGISPVFPEKLEVPPELDPETKHNQHTAPT